MTSLTLDSRLVPHPAVVFRDDFDDWAVLFHALTGEAKGIGPVGVAIWKALDGTHTLREIAADITASCEDTPDTVLDDILAFAQELYRGLFATLVEEHGLAEGARGRD